MASTEPAVLGVDIGGSGIKAAPVDVRTGKLLAERQRIDTPQPATPEAVAEVVGQVVSAFSWTGPVGAAFPAVIQHGVVKTASNVDPSWVGTDIDAVLSARLGRTVATLNDADAAGLAEVRFGAGRGHDGVVLLITLGTGIGSALFVDGLLVPNTELGHIEVGGQDAETRAAAAVRTRKDLSWEKWGARVGTYLQRLEALLWPDLIIIGGGVSRRFDRFGPVLDTRTPVVPAVLGNEAGIVGAALVQAGVIDPDEPVPG
jgi:polyphosphate glucokinase